MLQLCIVFYKYKDSRLYNDDLQRYIQINIKANAASISVSRKKEI